MYKIHRCCYSDTFLMAKLNFPKTKPKKGICGLTSALLFIQHLNIQSNPKLKPTYYEKFHLE